MIAYSPHRPTAVLTRFVGDTDLPSLIATGQIAEVTTEEYRRLLRTYEVMQEVGLSAARGPENVRHSTGDRFTLIDYHTSEQTPETLEQRVVHFAGAKMLISNTPRGSQVPDYTTRYLDACVEVLGKGMAETIIGHWEQNGFRPPA
jgi:hypothetical protein